MPFNPNFTITPKTAAALMQIEGLRSKIAGLPITPSVIKSLRETARLQSVHYSTQIEGNRLTQKEVAQVINHGAKTTARARDENEVRGYYAALEWMESNKSRIITETVVKTIHALVEGGGKKTAHPTPYRDAQNVIRNSNDGAIVYLPPEAKDVPPLMSDLVKWIGASGELPVPIIAAMAHYQFATIHPYYDGNGRTARLLATLVLHRGGYDLKGLYSLEEYYARDLPAYYDAISRGDNHNYYMGRETADITPWLEYFIFGMLDAFQNVVRRAADAAQDGKADKSALLRKLSARQRKVLTLFTDSETITTNEAAALFGISPRAARFMIADMVKDGFLLVANPAAKARAYKLADEYLDIIS